MLRRFVFDERQYGIYRGTQFLGVLVQVSQGTAGVVALAGEAEGKSVPGDVWERRHGFILIEQLGMSIEGRYGTDETCEGLQFFRHVRNDGLFISH